MIASSKKDINMIFNFNLFFAEASSSQSSEDSSEEIFQPHDNVFSSLKTTADNGFYQFEKPNQVNGKSRKTVFLDIFL